MINRYKINIIFALLLLCISCDKESSEPRVIFKAIELTDQNNISFSYFKKNNGSLEPEGNKSYNYNDIYWGGEVVNENFVEVFDEKMYSDLVRQLDSENIEHNISVSYLTNKIQAVKIYSDKRFRDVDAGESLNQFFLMYGSFVYFSQNRYRLIIGDVLNDANIKYENLLFSVFFNIELNSPPLIADKYSFTLELTEFGGKKYKQVFSTIALN